MYYGDSIFTLTFTQVIKTSGSNAVVSQYLAQMFINNIDLTYLGHDFWACRY